MKKTIIVTATAVLLGLGAYGAVKFLATRNNANVQPIDVNVDASTSGRDISKLKKGYHIDAWAPGNYKYNYDLYSRRIGYDNALVRLHYLGPLSSEKKKAIREGIEAHLAYGQPDFMVTIYGMPYELSSSQDATATGDQGCDPHYVTYPPRDYNAWKSYVREWVTTLKSYNIKYWEVWNEPTDIQRPGCFWSGTEEEYLKLYKATVEAIREAYGGFVPASVKIGGPALSGFDHLNIFGGGRPLYAGLPEYARQNNLPLDFFSLHYVDPLKLSDATAKIRAELAKNNFSSTELIDDEYGVSPAKDRHASTAQTAGEFARFAKLGYARQATFKSIDEPSLDGTPVERFAWAGLFGVIKGAEFFITPKFNLFDAINRMGNAMIEVSAPAPITGAGAQFAWQDIVLATKSPDRVSVLLVSPVATQSFNLKITGLSDSFTSRTKYIIDSTHSNAYQVENRIKAQIEVIKKAAFEIADPVQREAIIGQELDKINNWPEVRLYSETKQITVSNGTYQETLTLEPYAVQMLVLLDGATNRGTDTQACTQEAKQCPGGSYVGRTGPNCEFAECQSEQTLLRACPEYWYANQMPGVLPSSGELPREYFIYKGERREVSEFDTDWIKGNCSVELEYVY